MNEKTGMALLIGIVGSIPLSVVMVVCLWEYRVWVGICLLMLLFLVVGVHVRGQITEQNIRLYRFHHQTETPLTTQQFHYLPHQE